MERITVSPDSVRSFIETCVDETNYHLLYGLHLLSKTNFDAVMDGLLNGDIFVEELTRLRAFTPEDVEAFLREIPGGWTTPGVAVPSVGTDGYAYLMDTLGLRSSFVAAATAARPAPSSATFLRSQIAVGGPTGHASVAEVESIFAARVLDGALAGNPLERVLPLEEADVRALVPDEASPVADLLWKWLGAMLSPLRAAVPPAAGADLLQRLVAIGPLQPALQLAPGLTGWILDAVVPSADFQLRVHREAAVRTALGPITSADITSLVEAAEGATPAHVWTNRSVAKLEFDVMLASAALAAGVEPADAGIPARVEALVESVAALRGARDRLRTFLVATRDGCIRELRGNYPVI
jgi:hypothetical protein